MIIKTKKLEDKLKFKIKNKDLFKTAFTHKSYNKLVNNEKLEFLGERVIGLILSKKLYDLYPNEDEGNLDKRFAKLVNRDTCSKIAWSIGLQDFIILGNSKYQVTSNDKKILSDLCEALIGAIYIDQDYYITEKIVMNLWNDNIKKSNITILDSKTKLQEYSLKHFKKLPIYKLLSSKGPKHNPTFKIGVYIVGSKQYVGIGKSKQEAELNAAKNLLKEKKIN